jgi:hypothetical protein
LGKARTGLARYEMVGRGSNKLKGSKAWCGLVRYDEVRIGLACPGWEWSD